MNSKDKIINQIATTGRKKFISTDVSRGEFVLAGPIPNGSDKVKIGYCLQIRKKAGIFESDIVFLRHYDGGVIAHQNQGFFQLTAEDERLARSIFDRLPENEDFSVGHTFNNQYKVGFIIEEKNEITGNKPQKTTCQDDITSINSGGTVAIAFIDL